MSLWPFVFDFDLKSPVQARREAQDGSGISGCVCLSAASSASRRLIRASQGTRRAGMSGIFSFGDFSLDKQRKATRPWGRKTWLCASTI